MKRIVITLRHEIIFFVRRIRIDADHDLRPVGIAVVQAVSFLPTRDAAPLIGYICMVECIVGSLHRSGRAAQSRRRLFHSQSRLAIPLQAGRIERIEHGL
jgi:hypothetical protein